MSKADLYQVIEAERPGLPPLTLRVVVEDQATQFVGGVPNTNKRAETYVLLSALPRELQEKVKLAIQAMLQGV